MNDRPVDSVDPVDPVDLVDLVERVERDWARVRPDLDVRPVLTVISIQRTSAWLQEELERAFAAHGLSPANYDVLATLYRSAPPEGLPLGRLGALMAITPPAVTKRVDPLEARGLVERTARPGDRRAAVVRLTAEGRATVERVLPGHLANEERLLAPLDEAERATLRALLAKLRRSPGGPDAPEGATKES